MAGLQAWRPGDQAREDGGSPSPRRRVLFGAPPPAAGLGGRKAPGRRGAGSARRRLPGRSRPCAARSGRSRSLAFPPRSPAPRRRGWPGQGRPRHPRGVEGVGTELRSPPLGELCRRRGEEEEEAGPGRRGPRRRSCPRREVAQAAGGGGGRDAGRRPAHLAPHSRGEGSDKGEGPLPAPALVSPSHFPGLGDARGSLAQVSWSDPSPPYPATRTMLGGVWK